MGPAFVCEKSSVFFNLDQGMFYLSAAYIVKTMISGGNLLKEYIEERAVAIANYIIDYNATVRQTARKFGISKSTVHTVVTK